MYEWERGIKELSNNTRGPTQNGAREGLLNASSDRMLN